ncbi:hypothetical protein OAL13_00270 [bacterium]|nr:hypothetical protein [bacterium]
MKPTSISMFANHIESDNSFEPDAEMLAQGEFYGDAKTGLEYVLEGGDVASAIDDLRAVHGSMAIDKSMLTDHPASVLGRALSDEMNASRISNRRDPVIRQPKSFR